MRSAADGAVALATALREHGGAVAELALEGRPDEREPGAPQIAATGPRTAGDEAEYELLIEMILEGSRLHYGGQRVVRTDDEDLALLAGDQLYALGLSRLAALGDLDAVAALADVISRLAQAHAENEPERADAIWDAGAKAIGWGGERTR